MKATVIALAAALAAAWLPAAAERTGEEIVKSKCVQCHEKGLHGAPRIDDRDAWTPRLKKGLDATVGTAIKGHGAMPARGGMADTTDAEFRAAVVYLFNPTYPPPKPAAAPVPPANQKVVDGTEIYLGMKPVKEGVYHLTITLRDEGTKKPIGNAQVDVRVTNPVMGTDSRKLAREDVGGIVSYGTEVRVTGKEPHAISVEVRRPNARPIETKFDFKG